MYDESIEVCEEDDDVEDEYELLAGRKRVGVSPVRRGPFRFQQQQRPSRSFVRGSTRETDSLGMSDEGSPAPASLPPQPQLQQHEQPTPKKKSLSSKEFIGSQSPQQSQDGGGGEGSVQHGNLISLASSYAKKLMSGSDKKDKPPADVVEATKRPPKGSGHEPKKQPQQQPPPPSSSSKMPQNPQAMPQAPLGQPPPHPLPQQSRSEEDEDDEDDEEDEYDDVNMAQIEGLLRRVEKPPSSFFTTRPFPPPAESPTPISGPPRQSILEQCYDYRAQVDRGGGGDPYSLRATPHPTALGYHPAFGPATANLMNFAGSLSDSDSEISISEGDLNRMDSLMAMYTNSPEALVGDPESIIMNLPTSQLSNMSIVDEEVLENMLAQRKMWEYQLDVKRESLRRRTLVMSDYPGVHAPGHTVYNPQDYEHLNVSPEVKELFHYITRYEPPGVGSQMDVKLKPFIPEYYPSVGDIDAFIKVTHPEIQDDTLGIKCLDEPSPFQSDPSVLDLRLRALAKQSSSKSVVVKKIDNVGKNSKIIENWIKDISDLHRSKPSPSVHYSKPMPDIDLLIQEWPPQVEELLKNISLPSAELDCDLATYVDIVCNLLDIPVYKSRIQSLHVLFTLYATYKHFNHYGPLGMASGNDLDNLLPSSTSARLDDTDVDRLQIN